MLSLVLLPLGLIAVVQTQSVAERARSNAELALLSLTEQAAMTERLVLREAIGAATALGLVVADSLGPDLTGDPARCSAYLRRFVESSARYSFASYLPPTGIITCSSGGASYDFSESERIRDLLNNPAPQITVNRSAPISQTSIISANQPIYRADGEFAGYVSISIPHSRLQEMRSVISEASLAELVTFNARGEILSALGDIDLVVPLLPADVTLDSLARGGRRAFTRNDSAGTPRIYTVSPIENERIYVLGIWDADAGLATQAGGGFLTIFVPALMWLATLGVAIYAVHRLVTRHLTRLGRQMAMFAAARRLPAETVEGDPPTEIRRIHRAFDDMTAALMRDEASLENAVREKSVLVKEIHHRVKNNLQLISSIINLQIRDADSAEAKAALRQTQDRVLSMATIHRDLYQTNETGLVDVGHLMREVVTKSIEVTPAGEEIDLRLDIDQVWLYPDQAVPMSLLASEAVINALKHMPGLDAPKEDRWISVSFHEFAGPLLRVPVAQRGAAVERAASTQARHGPPPDPRLRHPARGHGGHAGAQRGLRADRHLRRQRVRPRPGFVLRTGSKLGGPAKTALSCGRESGISRIIDRCLSRGNLRLSAGLVRQVSGRRPKVVSGERQGSLTAPGSLPRLRSCVWKPRGGSSARLQTKERYVASTDIRPLRHGGRHIAIITRTGLTVVDRHATPNLRRSPRGSIFGAIVEGAVSVPPDLWRCLAPGICSSDHRARINSPVSRRRTSI